MKTTTVVLLVAAGAGALYLASRHAGAAPAGARLPRSPDAARAVPLTDHGAQYVAAAGSALPGIITAVGGLFSGSGDGEVST